MIHRVVVLNPFDNAVRASENIPGPEVLARLRAIAGMAVKNVTDELGAD